jgi:polysaccharide pyruvyl transferase WcaK-like protein
VNIIVDAGTRDCRNVGDVAMLQVAVERLGVMVPGATIYVLIEDAVELKRHCPSAVPLSHAGREAWFDNQSLSGRVYNLLPQAGRALVQGGHRYVRNWWPSTHASALLLKERVRGRSTEPLREFLSTMAKADLLVFCGQGTLADAGGQHARIMLETAAMAIRQGIPVVMVGQGVGPLTDPALLALARAVVPRVALIALREARGGPALLRALGVADDRIVITGDDAVELAARRRSGAPGTHIGIHARIAPHAITDHAVLDRVRDVVQAAARARGAALVPLPISHHKAGAYDPATIRLVMGGADAESDGGVDIDSPERTIEAAARCRMVVTGAYHAAVFALSQGIPAICLGRSPYYLEKFYGLVDLFGPGCTVVDLDSASLTQDLAAAIEHAWAAAPAQAEGLRAAAARQVALGRAAYARIPALLGGRPSFVERRAARERPA